MSDELDLDALESLMAYSDPSAPLDHIAIYHDLRNAAPALFAAARERDSLKDWSKNLHFELLHNYQHAHASHSIRPKLGGDIIEWAAQELAALRALVDKS